MKGIAIITLTLLETVICFTPGPIIDSRGSLTFQRISDGHRSLTSASSLKRSKAVCLTTSTVPSEAQDSSPNDVVKAVKVWVMKLIKKLNTITKSRSGPFLFLLFGKFLTPIKGDTATVVGEEEEVEDDVEGQILLGEFTPENDESSPASPEIIILEPETKPIAVITEPVIKEDELGVSALVEEEEGEEKDEMLIEEEEQIVEEEEQIVEELPQLEAVVPSPISTSSLSSWFKFKKSAKPSEEELIAMYQKQVYETKLLARERSIKRARKQPKPHFESKSLSRKYAQIESVEERAFTILYDLGMIEMSPDPEDVDYYDGLDDEFCEGQIGFVPIEEEG